MLNQIIIMGRLTRDPEVRKVGDGISITNITLACERDSNSKAKEKETDFIDCVAWRRDADYIAKYFKKGQIAVVHGRLAIHNFKDKSGNSKQKAEITINNIYSIPSTKLTPDDSGSHTGGTVSTSGDSGYCAPPAPESDFALLDDDDGQLPF